jgi:hypothetical protein
MSQTRLRYYLDFRLQPLLAVPAVPPVLYPKLDVALPSQTLLLLLYLVFLLAFTNAGKLGTPSSTDFLPSFNLVFPNSV